MRLSACWRRCRSTSSRNTRSISWRIRCRNNGSKDWELHMKMEGFTRTEINTSGARIVTVHGGKGPPLLLMHGNPFSHLSWHKIAPRLAQEFTVVATDLRGYGDS